MKAKRMVVLILLASFFVGQNAAQEKAKAPSWPAPISVAPPLRAVGPERSLIPSRPIMAAERKVMEPGTEVARPAARTIEVVATGYAKGDGSGETTFTGTQVHWGVVAVDPRTIPLGSEIRIKLPIGEAPMANEVSSTVFKAEDTGRLVKGSHIDIWFPELQAALDWGRRWVKIAVIPPSQSAPS